MKKSNNNAAEVRVAIGQMSPLLDVPERTLYTIVRDAGLQATAEGQSVTEVARAAIQYYRAEARAADSEAVKDRARKLKSEANTAEMEEGKMLRTLCSRDDYRSNYADAVAQGVRNIMRIPGLASDMRAKVFAAIRDVTLPEPAEEK